MREKSLHHATEKKFVYASFDMMKNKVFVLVGLLFMFHEICHCQKKFSKLNLKANMSKESMTGLHQIVSCSYDKNIISKHIKSFVYSTKEWKTFYWQFSHTFYLGRIWSFITYRSFLELRYYISICEKLFLKLFLAPLDKCTKLIIYEK